MNEITSISPIDGRYHRYTKELSEYFSEKALFIYRIKIEATYLNFLLDKLFDLTLQEKLELNELLDRLNNITNEDIMEIKSIERTINHDVKSVEYFIKNQLDIFPSLRKYKEYIHFGLTSQDINNPSLTLILKDSINT